MWCQHLLDIYFGCVGSGELIYLELSAKAFLPIHSCSLEEKET